MTPRLLDPSAKTPVCPRPVLFGQRRSALSLCAVLEVGRFNPTRPRPLPNHHCVMENLVYGVVALLLFLYLGIVMIRPEKF